MAIKLIVTVLNNVEIKILAPTVSAPLFWVSEKKYALSPTGIAATRVATDAQSGLSSNR